MDVRTEPKKTEQKMKISRLKKLENVWRIISGVKQQLQNYVHTFVNWLRWPATVTLSIGECSNTENRARLTTLIAIENGGSIGISFCLHTNLSIVRSLCGSYYFSSDTMNEQKKNWINW